MRMKKKLGMEYKYIFVLEMFFSTVYIPKNEFGEYFCSKMPLSWYNDSDPSLSSFTLPLLMRLYFPCFTPFHYYTLKTDIFFVTHFCYALYIMLFNHIFFFFFFSHKFTRTFTTHFHHLIKDEFKCVLFNALVNALLVRKPHGNSCA